MKRTFALIAIFSFSALLHAAETKVIIAPVDHLFVPKGFDNNDNVEVVVTGKFPNPCYIKNRSTVKIVDNKIHIKVTALNRSNGKNELCEAMTVPFKEEITIGNLQGGDYEIIVNGKSRFEKRKKLDVAVSNSTSVDDYLYPMVEYVDLGFTGGHAGSAFIIAKSPSDCLVLDRVEYISNGDDTISVLPIMKKVSPICNDKQTLMDIPIKYDLHALPHKEVLLFVRSIEGKAVNSLIRR